MLERQCDSKEISPKITMVHYTDDMPSFITMNSWPSDDFKLSDITFSIQPCTSVTWDTAYSANKWPVSFFSVNHNGRGETIKRSCLYIPCEIQCDGINHKWCRPTYVPLVIHQKDVEMLYDLCLLQTLLTQIQQHFLLPLSFFWRTHMVCSTKCGGELSFFFPHLLL